MAGARGAPLTPGDVVWARLPGYPVWPARVLDAAWVGRARARSGRLWVMFFNDGGQMASVSRKTARRFRARDAGRYVPKRGAYRKRVVLACRQAEEYAEAWEGRVEGGFMERGFRSDRPTREMIEEMEADEGRVWEERGEEEGGGNVEGRVESESESDVEAEVVQNAAVPPATPTPAVPPAAPTPAVPAAAPTPAVPPTAPMPTPAAAAASLASLASTAPQPIPAHTAPPVVPKPSGEIASAHNIDGSSSSRRAEDSGVVAKGSSPYATTEPRPTKKAPPRRPPVSAVSAAAATQQPAGRTPRTAEPKRRRRPAPRGGDDAAGSSCGSLVSPGVHAESEGTRGALEPRVVHLEGAGVDCGGVLGKRGRDAGGGAGAGVAATAAVTGERKDLGGRTGSGDGAFAGMPRLELEAFARRLWYENAHWKRAAVDWETANTLLKRDNVDLESLVEQHVYELHGQEQELQAQWEQLDALHLQLSAPPPQKRSRFESVCALM
jgi:PWWP domain